MELYIFDNTRKMSGIIESYEYLRWTRRYSLCGNFEIKAISTDENTSMLKIGNLLWKSDDEEAGIIEYIELTMRDQELITASGRFATGFLARRIVWNTEILSGDLAAGIGQLLKNHIISPTDTDRVIGGITYTPTNTGININTQISFRNLMDAACDLCDAADMGIKTVFAPATGGFTVTLYKGNDTQCVFSKEFENIIEQIFTQSVADYANTALVGGEGDGSARVLVSTGGGSGEGRYEIFVDAKDLRSENFPSDYNAALTFRGDSKLAESAMVQAFDAAINTHGNLAYKTDYDIGSSVTVMSKKWGVTMTARITEIEESYDREGMGINVIFGKPLLTLSQRMQNLQNLQYQ